MRSIVAATRWSTAGSGFRTQPGLDFRRAAAMGSLEDPVASLAIAIASRQGALIRAAVDRLPAPEVTKARRRVERVRPAAARPARVQPAAAQPARVQPAAAAVAQTTRRGNCTIQAPTECTQPSLTYADVEPIFASRCVVCHAVRNPALGALNTDGHVAHWRDTIRAAPATCAMPPAEAQMALPEAESLLILNWIRCGMPP